MRHYELAADDRVVLDVGHSGGVTGIATVGDVVVSGARDGFVYLRALDGRSVAPPLHLRAVTALTALGDSHICLVATTGRTYGVNATTGASNAIEELADTTVLSLAPRGDEALAGCVDGTVRRISLDDGVETFAALSAPVDELAAMGSYVLAATLDAMVTLLGPDGEVRWQLDLARGYQAVAATSTHAYVALDDPEERDSQTGLPVTHLAMLDADGERERRRLPAPVTCMVTEDESLVLAVADGSIHRLSPGDDAAEIVATPHTIRIEHLSRTSAGTWFGTAEGGVHRLEPPLALPQRSSGVVALSVDVDRSRAVAVDGRTLLAFDLTTGTRTDLAEVHGAIAVTFADQGQADVVLAFLDGRVERRAAPDYTEVTAEGRLPVRPDALGHAAGLILAQAEEGEVWLHAQTLAPVDEGPDVVSAAVVQRTGFVFRGTGASGGIQLGVIDGQDLVLVRPGHIALTEGAVEVTRVVRRGQLLELP